MFDPIPYRLRSNSNPPRPRTSPQSSPPPVTANAPKSPSFLLKRRSSSPVAIPSVPPRPPRNPARVPPVPHVRARPSTSSGTQDRKPFWDLSFTSKNTSVHPLSPLPHAPSTDFSLLKRNKSTGSKISRFRSNVQSAVTDDLLHTHAGDTQLHSTKSTAPPRSSKVTFPTQPIPPPSPPAPLPHKKPQPQFSTADRTILEELKRNISAHEAQFVIKGSGASAGRHHPYPPSVVPYPRSYAREAVDMDVWETAFCQQICASLTFHVFDVPPTKVLDVGCGTGAWILDCAREWRRCHFVGLDIVPLHPDLQRVGSSELASRITWVQANFLEGLPFPNEEFDFVHVKRIARGVPEDKWDPLLEEITRVMKPGGAFEMVEEDLFFPGSYTHDDKGVLPSTDPTPSDGDVQPLADSSDCPPTPAPHTLSPRSSDHNEIFPATTTPTSTSAATSSMNVTTPQETHHDEAPSRQEKDGALASRQPGRMFPLQRKRSVDSASQQHRVLVRPTLRKLVSSTGSIHTVAAMDGGKHTSAERFFPSTRPRSAVYGVDMSGSRPDVEAALLSDESRGPETLTHGGGDPWDHSLLERIYTEMHESRFINLAPLSLLANSLGLYFKDVRTHPPLQLTFPPKVPSKHRTGDNPSGRHHGALSPERRNGGDHDDQEAAVRRRWPLETMPALLSADRSMWRRSLGGEKKDGGGGGGGTEGEERWVSVQGLLEGSSPYVSLDQSRMSAYSPSHRASLVLDSSSLPFPSLVGAVPAGAVDSDGGENGENSSQQQQQQSRMAPPSSTMTTTMMMMMSSRLPNPMMSFDLQTLNLHLALRTFEILACGEAMWEWVVEYQEKKKEEEEEEERLGGFGRSRDGDLGAIARLTRGDFDELVAKFELDMRHHMALGSALEDRFSWYQVRLPRNNGCEELWDDHQHGGVELRGGSERAGCNRLGRSLRVFAAWKAC